ncbi:hypothetical protein HA51_18095 [Pantoea rwandensis]|uniref:Uncharacterized protein n=1 Tax=Pantoea rwandensis TaxID=1076550 RepID=A0A1X1CTP8_9GAMM|nr:hypothetical protein HA51_18095 [Pantoea rwandensis]
MAAFFIMRGWACWCGPSRPFQQRKQMLASRLVPLWGWHFAALNGMRKPGEPAWMLAKGAAGTGKVPSAPVRQADE